MPMTSSSRPAKRECLRAVALFRICAEAMFTDNMGRRERERKRWNENNAAFPNKSRTAQTNAAQKSRLNNNPLPKKKKKKKFNETYKQHTNYLLRLNMRKYEKERWRSVCDFHQYKKA